MSTIYKICYTLAVLIIGLVRFKEFYSNAMKAPPEKYTMEMFLTIFTFVAVAFSYAFLSAIVWL